VRRRYRGLEPPHAPKPLWLNRFGFVHGHVLACVAAHAGSWWLATYVWSLDFFYLDLFKNNFNK
jgi:hypothetical protein